MASRHVAQLIEQAEQAAAGGRFAESSGLCREVVGRDPRAMTAWRLLGSNELQRNRPRDAAGFLKRALALEPDDVASLILLARACVIDQMIDEALKLLDRIERLAPGHPIAWLTRAEALDTLGDYAAVVSGLEPAVRTGRASPLLAAAYARDLGRLGRAEEGLEALRPFLLAGGLSPLEHRDVHLTRASLLERLGRFDEAFDAACAARERVTAPFDPAWVERSVGVMISQFTTHRIAARSRATRASDLPVFIVGLPRCGSTLVESILSAHPEAFGAGEIHLMPDIVESLPDVLEDDRPYPECMDALTEHAANRLSKAYLAGLRQRHRTARRIIDKNLGNLADLGLIGAILPGARVIHCRRNPLDLCVSCFLQRLDVGQYPFIQRLEWLGRYHRQYERLIDHWRRVLTIPILDVQYEELVEAPRQVIATMLEFVGLPWDDACLAFHSRKRLTGTLSHDQVNRPIYRSSVGRWRHYERHLEPLRRGLETPWDTSEAVGAEEPESVG